MKYVGLVISILIFAGAALISCAPAPQPTTAPVVITSAPVKETVQVQVTSAPVKETVQVPVVVTATPAPTAAPKTGGILIGARAADAKGLDPHKQTAFSSFRMLELLYDPLLAFDKDMKLVPNLATTWKWSADGKTLTMTLRNDVKFHNGDPMTSADVKFSFERILDPKTAAAARSYFTDIDTIDTPDPYTVVFNLKNPNASILSAMTSPNAAIINQKQVTGGADPAKVDVGTGPFMLDKWDPDQTLTMKANKNFWIPGEPHLDGIEWRTIPDESSILAGLRAKTLDFAIINDPRVAIRAGAGSSSLVISRAPALAYHVLQLNSSRPPFTDVRVRQAISCAIDRQQVVDTASLGEGEVTGPVTSLFYRVPINTLPCYKPDLAKAKQLLADAGKSTGISFKIMAASDEPPTAVAEAQSIQAQLKQIGIDTQIETLELGVYVDRWLKADFDSTVALNGGNPDPDIMLNRYWSSTGNLQNVANYNTPEIDKLLAQGRATVDPDQRKAIYDQIQQKLVEASPWIWMYVGYEYRVMQPYIKGFTPLNNGSLMYLRDAWMDK